MPSKVKTKDPFAGARATKGITMKHEALIWECMLGTVNARSPKGVVRYFDYDYEAAHKFARTADCDDLRVSKTKYQYADYPRRGQYALWGVRAK